MTEPKKGRTTLVCFLILLVIALIFNFLMILPYLLPVILGGILALLCNPLYIRLKKKISPRLAALITTLGLLFLVIAPVATFSVRAVKQGIAVADRASDNPDFSIESIVKKLSDWGPIDALIDDPKVLEAKIRGYMKNGVQVASALVLGIAAELPNILLQIALTCLTFYFVLVDWRTFAKWSDDKIPLEEEVRQKLKRSFNDTAVSVIWATIAAAASQTFVIMTGFIALGIPNVFLAGGATFILAWIPVLGCSPVWLAATIYLLFAGATTKAIIMVIIGLLAGIVDNLVRPMILKGRSSMHPLVSLVAIFGGIKMFGLMGVFLGPIAIAILIDLLQSWPPVGHRFGLRF